MGNASGRRRFQLHLSTCVLLMLEGAILIGVNVVGNGDEVPELFGEKYGWPAVAFERYVFVDFGELGPANNATYQGYRTRWVASGLAINLGAGLLIMGLTVFVCERLIRFRARKRKDPAP